MDNLENNSIYIFLLIISFIIVIIFIINKVKFFSNATNSNFKNTKKFHITKMNTINKDESDQIFLFEKLLPSYVPEERNLIEITNSSIVARLSQSIPNAAEVLTKTITNNAIKNAEIYEVIIPSGAQLVNSRAIEGASRGIFRGTKGIKGHADLIKFDPKNISNASKLANATTNIINIGSMVVGQYYMSEINSKLENICEDIRKISDFQEREFKSRILTLISKVQKISCFSYEILENDELRLQYTHTLEDLETEGIQLLQQVNLTIEELLDNNRIINYNQYQIMIRNCETQSEYQQVLISILYEISKLVYLFGRGTRSSNLCFSLFNKYQIESKEVRSKLREWHIKQLKLLEIDIKNNRIKRKGIKGAIAIIPAIIDEKWKYKALEENFGNRIAYLIKDDFAYKSQDDIYEKDVRIVAKNGKYYYQKDITNN